MRVQVNLSDELLAKTDYYAKKMGVTRSSLCSMLISQGIMSYENTYDVLKNLGDKIGESILKDKEIENI